MPIRKRFIATVLKKNGSNELEPLFDLIMYGATHAEASVDLEATRGAIDERLRLRNLQLSDFAGVVVYEPDELPVSTCEREYVERRILA